MDYNILCLNPTDYKDIIYYVPTNIVSVSKICDLPVFTKGFKNDSKSHHYANQENLEIHHFPRDDC
jgi:hypothetical protein